MKRIGMSLHEGKAVLCHWIVESDRGNMSLKMVSRTRLMSDYEHSRLWPEFQLLLQFLYAEAQPTYFPEARQTASLQPLDVLWSDRWRIGSQSREESKVRETFLRVIAVSLLNFLMYSVGHESPRRLAVPDPIRMQFWSQNLLGWTDQSINIGPDSQFIISDNLTIISLSWQTFVTNFQGITSK